MVQRYYSLDVSEEDEESMEIVTQGPFHLKLVCRFQFRSSFLESRLNFAAYSLYLVLQVGLKGESKKINFINGSFICWLEVIVGTWTKPYATYIIVHKINWTRYIYKFLVPEICNLFVQVFRLLVSQTDN